jgi:hypothetical protein
LRFYDNKELNVYNVCNDIISELFTDTQQGNFKEHIWIKIKNQKSELVIGSVYRSPNSSEDNAISMNNVMENIGQRNSPVVLILGDFNYPTINWNDETATGVKKRQSIPEHTFQQLFPSAS